MLTNFISLNKGIFTVKFVDELDFSNEPIYKEEIKRALAGRKYTKVIFDLADVDYIDSSGVGMLIYFKGFFEKERKGYYIKSPSETVSKIFAISSLDKSLNVIR